MNNVRTTGGNLVVNFVAANARHKGSALEYKRAQSLVIRVFMWEMTKPEGEIDRLLEALITLRERAAVQRSG